MKYELAKELKDAGFPQVVRRGTQLTPDFGVGAVVYAPTLEELIEACGDRYFRLVHTVENWQASVGVEEGYLWYMGATPTEAVARLWLALNKPNTTDKASS